MLVEPEIPQNTGSIGRLCAATGTGLHLVGRLGFSLDDRYLKRAGLDYWPHVRLAVHADWSALPAPATSGRRIAFSTHGHASYTEVDFRDEDWLVFGGESSGLPAALRDELAPLHRIPILNEAVRSLNLASAVSVVVYEALRQLGRV